jgi:hypothetical protein
MRCLYRNALSKEDFDAEAHTRLLVKFCIRTMDTYAVKMKGLEISWWKKPLVPCDYHEHPTEEDRKRCAMTE